MTDTEQAVFLDRFRHTVLRLMGEEELSIDLLCDQLNMSRSQVHRKVKQCTGNSTSIQVRQIKLHRASEYLRDTDMTIAQVSYACGIQSPQNMSKYFLLSYGLTPTQYRKQLASPDGDEPSSSPTQLSMAEPIDNRKSIAIFAFNNIDPDPKQSFLGIGIADEIMNGLMKLGDIKVIGSTSSLYSTNKSSDLKAINNELNADYYLSGSIKLAGETMRLIVQLMDAVDDRLVWTERYERPVQDLFEIQNEIAHKIVNKLKVTLDPNEQNDDLIENKTSSVKAYQLYLKGRHEFELRHDLDLCISYYTQALAIDPQFAHAYFGISFALIYKCIFKGASPKETLPHIEEAYESAIIINNTIPETYVIKAWIYFYFYHDLAQAITFMDKAIAIDDKLVDAFRIKGYFLTFSGRYDEGVAQAKIAFGLDPHGFNAWFSMADIYRRSRRYDEAITLFESLKESYPEIPIIREILGLSYFHGGYLVEAQQLLPLSESYPSAISLYVLAPYFLHHHIGDPQALSGLMAYISQLQKVRYIQPSILALLSYHLCDEAAAISYMDDAMRMADFGLKHIISEPYWDQYRQHDKVQDALRIVGMTEGL